MAQGLVTLAAILLLLDHGVAELSDLVPDPSDLADQAVNLVGHAGTVVGLELLGVTVDLPGFDQGRQAGDGGGHASEAPECHQGIKGLGAGHWSAPAACLPWVGVVRARSASHTGRRAV